MNRHKIGFGVQRWAMIAWLLWVGGAASAAPPETCGYDWSRGFNLAGVNGEVHAMAVFDDGTGPALYVGGQFNAAGDVPVNNIAKWDGESWSALGRGLTSMNGNTAQVHVLKVIDDGSGPALFVGGHFERAGEQLIKGVAKWNVGEWTALGDGLPGFVYDIEMFDAGTGPKLFAGGMFGGGDDRFHLASWAGTEWARTVFDFPHSDDTRVRALHVHDDGSGLALFAAGHFDFIGPVETHGVAKWNGTNWSAVGGGVAMNNFHVVNDLTTFAANTEGSTPAALVATGSFTQIGGISAANIAAWNGQTWTPLGSGLDGSGSAMRVLTQKSSMEAGLYVGGTFNHAGGQPSKSIALWNGLNWSALDIGFTGNFVRVHAIEFFTPESSGETQLVLAGKPLQVNSDFRGHVLTWNGAQVQSLGSGMIPKSATVLATLDDGTGSHLYCGASNIDPARSAVSRLVDGEWQSVGVGLRGFVNAIGVHDDGDGPRIYVSGYLLLPDGSTCGVMRLVGETWGQVGQVISSGLRPAAMTTFDDGTGPALYLAGRFHMPGSPISGNVLRLNGMQWTLLTTGTTYVEAGRSPSSMMEPARHSFLADFSCLNRAASSSTSPSGMDQLGRMWAAGFGTNPS